MNNDRYNFDKIGVIYLMPSSVGLGTVQKNGCKGVNTSLTYGFCMNRTGTDMHEPLINRHSCLPCYFWGKHVNRLGYNYYFHKKTWIIRTIWLEWLKRFDKYIQRKTCQIILLADKCSAHIKSIDYNLKAI